MDLRMGGEDRLGDLLEEAERGREVAGPGRTADVGRGRADVGNAYSSVNTLMSIKYLHIT